MPVTRINVGRSEVLVALEGIGRPASETEILLSIMGARGIKQEAKPGENPGDAIRRNFNVTFLQRVLDGLQGDGKVEMLSGNKWRERGVTFYDQRPTGKYWAVAGYSQAAKSEVKETDMSVKYTVQSHANWTIPLDVTGAPDTTNPESPSSGTIRPTALGMSIFPNSETGVWEVVSVSVVGPKVKDGKVVTKRDYAIAFMDPLGSESVAPEWVRVICQEWVDKANGLVSGGAPLTDRQVYDLNNRMHSNLGLQPTREVLEDVLGNAPAVMVAPDKPAAVSPKRSRFDDALNVLLIAENLAGTEWAIAWLRDEGWSRFGPDAKKMAASLERDLDKRADELAAKD